jgi:citronellol/citronellal dehydrogenase
LPVVCDIRDERQIDAAVQKAVARFGGIDIVVNNASAISLTPTLSTSMRKFDLMHQVNVRGTFAVCKAALPFLLKASNPHILMLSPPLFLSGHWFEPHLAYTLSKYGMSMCVLGLAEEWRDSGVAVNALWPQTVIDTAALQAITPESRELASKGRTPEIMADAAYTILTQPSRTYTYLDWNGRACIYSNTNCALGAILRLTSRSCRARESATFPTTQRRPETLNSSKVH